MRLEKDMKSGDMPGILLLCGKEDYLTNHYRNKLIDRSVEPVARQLDLTEFTDEQVDVSAIVEAAETLPLMSPKKVIHLPGLIDAQGRYPKKIDRSPDEIARLEKALSEMPEHTLVIITADKPRTTGDYKKQSDGRKLSKLAKVVTKAGGSVYDFDTLDKAQLRNFAKKRFQAAGKDCTNDVLRRITYDTGYGSRYTDYNLYLLENDLKKIIAVSGEKAIITEDDLKNTLTISPENNVFQMIDALGRGRKDQALIDLNTLMESGESEFSILSNVVRQIELMLIVRELMDDNNSGNEIARYLQKKEKVSEFRAKKVIEVTTRFGRDHLKSMLMNAIAVEDNIKSGIMSSRLALEYFITV